jgi:hypothetical protein
MELSLVIQHRYYIANIGRKYGVRLGLEPPMLKGALAVGVVRNGLAAAV